MKEFKLSNPEDIAPTPDLARCEECNWAGRVSDCFTSEEGDWENGYYLVDLCPECGGGIAYDMTRKRAKEWNKWWNKNNKEKMPEIEQIQRGIYVFKENLKKYFFKIFNKG